MITSIDYPQFNEATGSGACLVEFWAEWCAPCRSMGELIEEISDLYNEELSFFKVNIDNNHFLAREMKVGSIPTLLLMEDGKIVRRWQGLTARESIESEINRMITDN